MMSSANNSQEYIYNWNIDIVQNLAATETKIDRTWVNVGHGYKDLEPIRSPICTRARCVDRKLARPQTMRQASKTATRTAIEGLRQEERVRYQVFRVLYLGAMDR